MASNMGKDIEDAETQDPTVAGGMFDESQLVRDVLGTPAPPIPQWFLDMQNTGSLPNTALVGSSPIDPVAWMRTQQESTTDFPDIKCAHDVAAAAPRPRHSRGGRKRTLARRVKGTESGMDIVPVEGAKALPGRGATKGVSKKLGSPPYRLEFDDNWQIVGRMAREFGKHVAESARTLVEIDTLVWPDIDAEVIGTLVADVVVSIVLLLYVPFLSI
jgi:hypothetical protein